MGKKQDNNLSRTGLETGREKRNKSYKTRKIGPLRKNTCWVQFKLLKITYKMGISSLIYLVIILVRYSQLVFEILSFLSRTSIIFDIPREFQGASRIEVIRKHAIILPLKILPQITWSLNKSLFVSTLLETHAMCEPQENKQHRQMRSSQDYWTRANHSAYDYILYY